MVAIASDSITLFGCGVKPSKTSEVGLYMVDCGFWILDFGLWICDLGFWI